MAKKNLDVDVVPNGILKVQEQPSLLYVAGIFLVGFMVYRSGYRTGADVSKKVLKRHDKDVRRMKKDATKREKQIRKELTPETEKRKWWQRQPSR